MSTTDSQSPTACLTAIVGDELSCAKLGHLASQIRTEAAKLGQYQFAVLAPGIARMSRTRRNKRRPSDLPPKRRATPRSTSFLAVEWIMSWWNNISGPCRSRVVSIDRVASGSPTQFRPDTLAQRNATLSDSDMQYPGAVPDHLKTGLQ
jgi:hypothetical protein